MALIDCINHRFIGIGDYGDRHVFKDAGFTWNAIRKRWITDSLAVASKADALFTERATLEALGRDAKSEKSHTLSYAKDTEFNPPTPAGLEFRPFQKAGIQYAILRKDTLIADPPGLGKTVQAVGVSNVMPAPRRILVIGPASLKENWRREWLRWTTHSHTVGIAEATKKVKRKVGKYKNGNDKFKVETIKDFWPDTDVVVVNYDILARFEDIIKSQKWDLLVCDEAHALKNPEAMRTLQVLGGSRLEDVVSDRHADLPKKYKPKKKKKRVYYKPIDADRRLFLTGTPILSRPVELWSLLRATDPDGLGRDYDAFVYRYCAARKTIHGLDVSGASNMEELGEHLRRILMVRRQKKEVLPELPDVQQQVVLIESPEISKLVAREDELAQQLKLYEAVLTEAGGDLDTLDAALGASIAEVAATYGLDNSGGSKPKIDYVAQVLGLEPPAVEILFEELAAVRREIGVAKVPVVVDWVRNFLEGNPGEKLILFAYHKDVVRGLHEQLAEYNPGLIYGSTPVNKRQLQVDKLQEDETCRLIVGNLHSMGTGFTMTRAANVAFAEGDWVPSLLRQAEDRSCRMGQEADRVLAAYIMANGSIDAKIAQTAVGKELNIAMALDT